MTSWVARWRGWWRDGMIMAFNDVGNSDWGREGLCFRDSDVPVWWMCARNKEISCCSSGYPAPPLLLSSCVMRMLLSWRDLRMKICLHKGQFCDIELCVRKEKEENEKVPKEEAKKNINTYSGRNTMRSSQVEWRAENGDNGGKVQMLDRWSNGWGPGWGHWRSRK